MGRTIPVTGRAWSEASHSTASETSRASFHGTGSMFSDWNASTVPVLSGDQCRPGGGQAEDQGRGQSSGRNPRRSRSRRGSARARLPPPGRRCARPMRRPSGRPFLHRSPAGQWAPGPQFCSLGLPGARAGGLRAYWRPLRVLAAVAPESADAPASAAASALTAAGSGPAASTNPNYHTELTSARY